MPKITLTDDERLLLMRVLDFRLSLTRKSTPMLLPLSFYSSELKGTQQTANALDSVRKNGILSTHETSRARYFNSLSNQALVEGDVSAPKLTPLASHYLNALDSVHNDDFWQGEGGDSVELSVIRALIERLTLGEAVSDNFKSVWFNAQTFFDYVPPSDLPAILSNRDSLLSLFRINSNGWEIGRYFRLDETERASFDSIFAKILPTEKWKPSAPIEISAAQYKDAAESIQKDVRFRISGFLNAYNQLRTELGPKLPRLDRQLTLRIGTTAGGGSRNISKHEISAATAKPLPYPHQLIVTGCPGSGKSYFINNLIDSFKCRVFRTQFHPESSFFDFVGAYKPQPVYESVNSIFPLEEGDGTNFPRGKPLIDYRFVPGPLIQSLAYAISHPDENVVVLIEEINRGNAASIFGDILQLLDRKDDGQSRYEIMATLELKAYFAKEGYSVETISLPANLYLWATMNSADQGVFPLDTAFRRRWSYIYKGYSESCLYSTEKAEITYGGQTFGWDAFRGTLNHHLVELGIHEDKLIGPYFLTEQQLADPASVLEKLFLYLWDDVLRFRQDSLFVAKSFSLVSASWANGAGEPLHITLQRPLESEKITGQLLGAVDDNFDSVTDEPATTSG